MAQTRSCISLSGEHHFRISPHAFDYCPHARSLFFPIATPQLIEALVNTLLNLVKPFPFVLALGGKLAALPKELIERVNSTGKGLVCDFWVEQRAILQHPAVGWFLTHGGFK
jgi:hypothetical protein